MLIDDHIRDMERDVKRTHADAAAHDEMLPRLRNCVRYRIDDDVMEVANALAYGDIENFVKNLDLARAPHPKMWIEYSGAARLRWYQKNEIAHSDPKTWPITCGNLVEDVDGGFRVTNVNSMPGLKRTNPVGASGVVLRSPTAIDETAVEADWRNQTSAEGAPQISLKLYKLLMTHLKFEVNVYDRIFEGAGMTLKERCVGWSSDIQPEMMVTAALFLMMNVSGMVENGNTSEKVPFSERRNKGRSEKRDITVVRIARSFESQAKLLVASHDKRPGHITPHIVRGHFKRLARGLTWWNSHVRGNASKDENDDIAVKDRIGKL